MKKFLLFGATLFSLFILASCGSKSNDSSSSNNDDNTSYTESDSSESSSTSESSTSQSSSDTPLDFKNALKDAQNKADNDHFSESRIKNDLIGSYSSDAVDYAISNVKVDWNQNAVYYAQQYINNSGKQASDQDWNKMDRALINKYGGGFTRSQASYALDTLHVPYNSNN